MIHGSRGRAGSWDGSLRNSRDHDVNNRGRGLADSQSNSLRNSWDHNGNEGQRGSAGFQNKSLRKSVEHDISQKGRGLAGSQNISLKKSRDRGGSDGGCGPAGSQNNSLKKSRNHDFYYGRHIRNRGLAGSRDSSLRNSRESDGNDRGRTSAGSRDGLQGNCRNHDGNHRKHLRESGSGNSQDCSRRNSQDHDENEGAHVHARLAACSRSGTQKNSQDHDENEGGHVHDRGSTSSRSGSRKNSQNYVGNDERYVRDRGEAGSQDGSQRHSHDHDANETEDVDVSGEILCVKQLVQERNDLLDKVEHLKRREANAQQRLHRLGEMGIVSTSSQVNKKDAACCTDFDLPSAEDLQRIQAARDSMANELFTAQRECAAVKQECDEVQGRLREEHAVRAKIERSVVKLGREKEMLEQGALLLKDQLALLQQEKETKLQEFAVLQQEARDMEVGIDKLQKTGQSEKARHEKEFAELMSVNGELRARIRGLDNSLADARNHNLTLDLNAGNRESELKEQLLLARREYDTMEDRFSDEVERRVRNEVERSKEEMTRKHETRARELERQLFTVQRERDDMRCVKQALEARLVQIEEEDSERIRLVKNELAEARAQQEHFAAATEMVKVHEQSQLKTATREFEIKLQAEKDAASRLKESFEQQITHLTKERTATEERLGNAQQHLTTVVHDTRNTLGAKQEEIEALRADVVRAEMALCAKEEEMEHFRQQSHEHRDLVSAQMAQLSKDYDGSKDAVRQAQSQLDTQRKRETQHIRQISELKEQVSRMQSAIAQKMAEQQASFDAEMGHALSAVTKSLSEEQMRLPVGDSALISELVPASVSKPTRQLVDAISHLYARYRSVQVDFDMARNVLADARSHAKAQETQNNLLRGEVEQGRADLSKHFKQSEGELTGLRSQVRSCQEKEEQALAALRRTQQTHTGKVVTLEGRLADAHEKVSELEECIHSLSAQLKEKEDAQTCVALLEQRVSDGERERAKLLAELRDARRSRAKDRESFNIQRREDENARTKIDAEMADEVSAVRHRAEKEVACVRAKMQKQEAAYRTDVAALSTRMRECEEAHRSEICALEARLKEHEDGSKKKVSALETLLKEREQIHLEECAVRSPEVLKREQALDEVTAALEMQLTQREEAHKKETATLEARLLQLEELYKEKTVVAEARSLKREEAHAEKVATLESRLLQYEKTQKDEASSLEVQLWESAELEARLQECEKVHQKEIASLETRIQEREEAHQKEIARSELRLQEQEEWRKKKASALEDQQQREKAREKEIATLQARLQEREMTHQKEIAASKSQLREREEVSERAAAKLQAQVQELEGTREKEIAGLESQLLMRKETHAEETASLEARLCKMGVSEARFVELEDVRTTEIASLESQLLEQEVVLKEEAAASEAQLMQREETHKKGIAALEERLLQVEDARRKETADLQVRFMESESMYEHETATLQALLRSNNTMCTELQKTHNCSEKTVADLREVHESGQKQISDLKKHVTQLEEARAIDKLDFHMQLRYEESVRTKVEGELREVQSQLERSERKYRGEAKTLRRKLEEQRAKMATLPALQAELCSALEEKRTLEELWSADTVAAAEEAAERIAKQARMAEAVIAHELSTCRELQNAQKTYHVCAEAQQTTINASALRAEVTALQCALEYARNRVVHAHEAEHCAEVASLNAKLDVLEEAAVARECDGVPKASAKCSEAVSHDAKLQDALEVGGFELDRLSAEADRPTVLRVEETAWLQADLAHAQEEAQGATACEPSIKRDVHKVECGVNTTGILCVDAAEGTKEHSVPPPPVVIAELKSQLALSEDARAKAERQLEEASEQNIVQNIAIGMLEEKLAELERTQQHYAKPWRRSVGSAVTRDGGGLSDCETADKSRTMALLEDGISDGETPYKRRSTPLAMDGSMSDSETPDKSRTMSLVITDSITKRKTAFKGRAMPLVMEDGMSECETVDINCATPSIQDIGSIGAQNDSLAMSPTPSPHGDHENNARRADMEFVVTEGRRRSDILDAETLVRHSHAEHAHVVAAAGTLENTVRDERTKGDTYVGRQVGKQAEDQVAAALRQETDPIRELLEGKMDAEAMWQQVESAEKENVLLRTALEAVRSELHNMSEQVEKLRDAKRRTDHSENATGRAHNIRETLVARPDAKQLCKDLAVQKEAPEVEIVSHVENEKTRDTLFVLTQDNKQTDEAVKNIATEEACKARVVRQEQEAMDDILEACRREKDTLGEAVAGLHAEKEKMCETLVAMRTEKQKLGETLVAMRQEQEKIRANVMALRQEKESVEHEIVQEEQEGMSDMVVTEHHKEATLCTLPHTTKDNMSHALQQAEKIADSDHRCEDFLIVDVEKTRLDARLTRDREEMKEHGSCSQQARVNAHMKSERREDEKNLRHVGSEASEQNALDQLRDDREENQVSKDVDNGCKENNHAWDQTDCERQGNERLVSRQIHDERQKKEQTLEQIDHGRKKNEEVFKKLHNERKEKEQALEKLYRERKENENVSEQLDNERKEKNQALEKLDRERKENEQVSRQLDNERKEKDQTLEKLDRERKENEQVSQQLDNERQEKEQALEQLDRERKEKDQVSKKLDNECKEKEQALRRINCEQKKNEQVSQKLDDERTDKEQALEQIDRERKEKEQVFQQLDTVRKEKEQALQQIERERKKNEQVSQQLDNERKDKKRVLEQIDCDRKQNDQISQQLDTVRRQKEQAVEQIDCERKENEQVTRQLDIERKEKEQALEQVDCERKEKKQVSHQRDTERKEKEQALEQLRNERKDKKQVSKQLDNERGEKEQALQKMCHERKEKEQVLQQLDMERKEKEQALRQCDHEREEKQRTLQQLVLDQKLDSDQAQEQLRVEQQITQELASRERALQDELAVRDAEVRDLVTEKENLERKLRDNRDLTATLTETTRHNEAHIGDLRNKLAKVTQTSQHKESRLYDLRCKLTTISATKDAQIRDLRSELTSLAQASDQKHTVLQDDAREARSECRELEITQSEVTQRLDLCVADHTKQTTAMKRDHDALQSELAARTNDLKKAYSEVEANGEELEARAALVSTLQQEARLLGSEHAAHLDRWHSERATFETELEEVRAAVTKKEQVIAALMVDRHERHDALTAQDGVLRYLKEEHRAQRDEVSNLRTELQCQEERLVSEQADYAAWARDADERILTYEERLSEQAAKNQEAEEVCATLEQAQLQLAGRAQTAKYLEEQCSQQLRLLSTQEEQVASLQDQVRDLKRTSDDALRDETASWREKEIHWEEVLQRYKRDAALHRKKLSAATGECDRLRAELESKDRLNAQPCAEMHEQGNETRKAAQRIDIARCSPKQLREKLQRVEKREQEAYRRAEEQEQNACNRARLAEEGTLALKETLVEQQTLLTSLREEISSTRKLLRAQETKDAESALAEERALHLQAATDQLRAECDTLKEQCATALHEKESLAENYEQLQQRMRTYEQRLTDARSNAARQQATVDRLKMQMLTQRGHMEVQSHALGRMRLEQEDSASRSALSRATTGLSSASKSDVDGRDEHNLAAPLAQREAPTLAVLQRDFTYSPARSAKIQSQAKNVDTQQDEGDDKDNRTDERLCSSHRSNDTSQRSNSSSFEDMLYVLGRRVQSATVQTPSSGKRAPSPSTHLLSSESSVTSSRQAATAQYHAQNQKNSVVLHVPLAARRPRVRHAGKLPHSQDGRGNNNSRAASPVEDDRWFRRRGRSMSEVGPITLVDN